MLSESCRGWTATQSHQSSLTSHRCWVDCQHSEHTGEWWWQDHFNIQFCHHLSCIYRYLK